MRYSCAALAILLLSTATAAAQDDVRALPTTPNVRSILSLFPVTVVTTRPATGPYVMIVFGGRANQVGSRFGIAESAVTNYLAAMRRQFRLIALDVLREVTASEAEYRREAQTLFGKAP